MRDDFLTVIGFFRLKLRIDAKIEKFMAKKFLLAHFDVKKMAKKKSFEISSDILQKLGLSNLK
jgi:hypothetical protein